MDRFLQRRSSSEKTPMSSGAAAVHDSILNDPTTKEQQELPAQLGTAKCPKGQKCCSRCKQVKEEKNGFFVGKNKVTFYCSDCNSLEGRIQRLTKGLLIAKMWRDMSAEEKIAFRAEHSALEGAALKDQLTVTMVQKVKQEDSSFTGTLCEYLPLSVYQARGYDKAYLKHIEDTASMRLDGSIKTYALRVHREGDEKRLTEIRTTMWKPIGENHMKKATCSSDEAEDDSSDNTSDTDSDSDDRSKRAKKNKSKVEAKESRRKKVQELKRKKEQKVANRITDKIAPIESQLQQCKDRLTQEIKECLPPYQTMDMEQHLGIMQELRSKWSLVVKGSSTIKAEKLDEEETMTKIGQARVAATAFKMTLTGAETIVARRASMDDEAGSKKVKKRKKA